MWSSDALIVYARTNMEEPVWVSEVLGDGAGDTRGSWDKGLDGCERKLDK